MALIMDIEAIYQRGFQLRCEGRYGEARVELQKVLAANPSHINARHQMGLIQGFEGDFDGSLATLQELSIQYPANLDVRFDLAMTQMMLGYFDEGCTNFRMIVNADPDHPKASKAREQLQYC